MEDVFVQHIENEAFCNIRDGFKTMEIRLNDKKRQKIKLGMKIKLVNKDDESEFFVCSGDWAF